jgi:hypothetical protein
MYPVVTGTPPARLPAASRVDKATSHLLQGPDWAVNLEICDTLNADRWYERSLPSLSLSLSLSLSRLLYLCVCVCGGISKHVWGSSCTGCNGGAALQIPLPRVAARTAHGNSSGSGIGLGPLS